jgi:hypothetical protein
MRTDGEPADFFYQLDDPAFLAERARLRGRLEHVPENAIGRRRLERLYDAMTEEFCRRARIAWTRGRLPAQDDVDRARKAVGHVTGLERGQRPRARRRCRRSRSIAQSTRLERGGLRNRPGARRAGVGPVILRWRCRGTGACSARGAGRTRAGSRAVRRGRARISR